MTEMFTKLPVGCCKLHPIHIILVQSSYTDTNLTIPQKVEGRVNWSTAVVVLQPVPNAICNDNGNLYNTSLTWTFINKSDMHNVAWWNGSSLFGWVELGLELGLSSNNIPACTLKVNLLVIWDLMARSAQIGYTMRLKSWFSQTTTWQLTSTLEILLEGKYDIRESWEIMTNKECGKRHKLSKYRKTNPNNNNYLN